MMLLSSYFPVTRTSPGRGSQQWFWTGGLPSPCSCPLPPGSLVAWVSSRKEQLCALASPLVFQKLPSSQRA